MTLGLREWGSHLDFTGRGRNWRGWGVRYVDGGSQHVYWENGTMTRIQDKHLAGRREEEEKIDLMLTRSRLSSWMKGVDFMIAMGIFQPPRWWQVVRNGTIVR